MPVLLTEVGHWRLHSGVLKNYRLVFKRVMSDKSCSYGYIPRGRNRSSYHDNILLFPLNNTMNMIITQKLEVVLKGEC